MPAGRRKRRASEVASNGIYQRGIRASYRRYPKPPYSYAGMIAAAIWYSPNKALTLAEIKVELKTMFPFFRQDYEGWKDSVRHNLSLHDCFYKLSKSHDQPDTKGSSWIVLPDKLPLDIFDYQNTRHGKEGNYCDNLLKHLRLPPFPFPSILRTHIYEIRRVKQWPVTTFTTAHAEKSSMFPSNALHGNSSVTDGPQNFALMTSRDQLLDNLSEVTQVEINSRTASKTNECTSPSNYGSLTSSCSYGSLTSPSGSTSVTSPGVTSHSNYASPTAPNNYSSLTSPGKSSSVTSPSNYRNVTPSGNHNSDTSPSDYGSLTSPSGSTSVTSPGNYGSFTSHSNYASPTAPNNYSSLTSPGKSSSVTSPSNYRNVTPFGSHSSDTSPSNYGSHTSPSGYDWITSPSDISRLSSLHSGYWSPNYVRPPSNDNGILSPSNALLHRPSLQQEHPYQVSQNLSQTSGVYHPSHERQYRRNPVLRQPLRPFDTADQCDNGLYILASVCCWSG